MCKLHLISNVFYKYVLKHIFDILHIAYISVQK